MTIQKDQKQSGQKKQVKKPGQKQPLHSRVNKSQESPSHEKEQGKMQNPERHHTQAKKAQSKIDSVQEHE